MISQIQAKYYAHLLMQQSVGDDIGSLSQSLLSATVDINPHQVDAALFAFRSPFSKGVILADEVGLGKTIEAGLVICQLWAIGKRKIIVICPAALRKQWSYELTEKFGLANDILDAKNCNAMLRSGSNPFDQKKILICSYQFAAKHQMDLSAMGLDLAVLDEAHKLRNVYKKGSKTAHVIADTLRDVKKLLLTATPFQNSLMELYGLTSLIDQDIFGDAATFRSEYTRDGCLPDLKQVLSLFYKRTLRKDVTEYINYTKRLPLSQEFNTTDLEQKLYNDLSEFLRRDDLYAIPARQKMLTTMVIRKIMASSTYAIIGTLETIIQRLQKMLDSDRLHQLDLSDLLEAASELLDEEELEEKADEKQAEQPKLNREAIEKEIALLKDFVDTAKSISHDSKADALLLALHSAFEQVQKNGGNRKALIFTESTRTQQYLKAMLEANGYQGKLVLFNGSNADPESNAIYQTWLQQNESTGHASGIKAEDRRMALVEYFRDKAEIMIATEAAAEGLNLQFCSLVVNYDLPWNPQRIEQRIGRCHRYGQKHDVVVVNFVNRRNYADQRVYQLLEEKFHLFDDVFGASDEILGETDSADFERRIWSIYQECRTESEINAAFERLQQDMQPEIESRMSDVKQQVLTNFDIDVQERLRLSKEKTGAFLNRYEHILWELTKFVLADAAVFDDEKHMFRLTRPVAGCRPHSYYLLSDQPDGETYRLTHPLAQYVLATAASLPAASGAVRFTPEKASIHVELPEDMRHTSGWLYLEQMDITAFENEQHVLFNACTADGHWLSQEACERMFLLAGKDIKKTRTVPDQVEAMLRKNADQHRQSALQQVDSRNMAYFKEEEDRIFRLERDVVEALERELDTVKRQIRETERAVRQAATLDEKLEATKKLEALEKQKRRKRNELADREDQAADRRREMIEELDKRKIRQVKHEPIFTIHWEIA